MICINIINSNYSFITQISGQFNRRKLGENIIDFILFLCCTCLLCKFIYIYLNELGIWKLIIHNIVNNFTLLVWSVS